MPSSVRVLAAEDRRVVVVPGLAGDLDRRLAQLGGGRVRVLVEPVPHVDLDERRAGDLPACSRSRRGPAAAPPRRRGGGRPSSARSRAWNRNASASVNAVFGTPASSVWSIVVERERLLDVVAELVDRDVVALVVHAAGLDARAQVRLVAAALGAHARGRRRATDRPRCARRGSCALGGGEAEVAQDARHVLRERRRRRILLARDRVELGLGDVAAAELVPEVVRLELAAEASLDLAAATSAHQRRLEDLDEQRAHALPRASRRRRTRARCASARSARTCRSRRAARKWRATRSKRVSGSRSSDGVVGRSAGASRSIVSGGAAVTLLVNGFQSSARVVDHRLRDRLRDDALHQLRRSSAAWRGPPGRRSWP